MWLRIVASRVSRSTTACAASPGPMLPLHRLQRERLIVAQPEHVGHAGASGRRLHRPVVGHLAAALGIEGALLQLGEQRAVLATPARATTVSASVAS